jgi:predicted ATPase
LTPLVGREQEVGLLRERWTQVQDGRGQVIILHGEAGIGKSRLVHVVTEHVADAPHTRWECRCSPYYHNTALYPLIDVLQRALHWHLDETAEAKLGKLEHFVRQAPLPLDETVPLFATLLSLPLPAERYPPLALPPQLQRQKTFEALLAAFLTQAADQPVLFIIEDLHWVDPTTVEWLSLAVDQAPTTALCLLVTCRPEFPVPWGSRSYLTQVTLTRLPRPQVAQMVTHVIGGKQLPPDVLQHVLEKRMVCPCLSKN